MGAGDYPMSSSEELSNIVGETGKLQLRLIKDTLPVNKSEIVKDYHIWFILYDLDCYPSIRDTMSLINFDWTTNYRENNYDEAKKCWIQRCQTAL